jgi:(p)ppGpp synthase/HD superfamily hydrolase
MSKFLYSDKALNIATKYHKSQKRRDGSDYINHPFAVGNCFENDILKAIGYLHDTIEDTAYSEKQIKKDFPKDIVDAVIALTHYDNISYIDYIKKIKKNKLATLVKIQDIKHNLNDKPSEKQKEKYKYALNLLN